MQRSEQWTSLMSAFVLAQAEFTTALKTKTADASRTGGGGFKFDYADLRDVDEACKPALNKYGIGVLHGPEVTEDGATYVETMLVHGKSGEWVSCKIRMKPTQNTPQAIGSALTYARRYGLAHLCAVVTEDDDGAEASKPSPADRKQRAVPPKPSDEQVTKETITQAVIDWLDIKREDVAGVVSKLKLSCGITGQLQPAEYPSILKEIEHHKNKGVTLETLADALKPKDND